MLISFGKATLLIGTLALSGTLSGVPSYRTLHHETAHPSPPKKILMIRVSQESAPGAGDFDQNILGFTRALQSLGIAGDFYQYGRAGPNYGNTVPILTSNTSHIFFVNAGDGLAFIIVNNASNMVDEHSGNGGEAKMRFDLAGGSASILTDDDGECVSSDGGTVLTCDEGWAQQNTDGVVFGALPVGFSLVGGFTATPTNIGGGWEVISDDGSKIPLSLVPGQRVRLDVKLAVPVAQDH